jgi:transcriptional regulator with XRE-family HTH domain
MNIDEAKKIFGENLEKIRLEKGFTISEDSKKVRISLERYRRMEAGQIALKLVTPDKLAKALGG